MKKEELRVRDPFIFVEDGRYYLVGTMQERLTLWESKDLVEFENVGCMVDLSALEDYRDFWAPELHKYQGKYYLIVSLYRDDLGRGSMIFVSDTLKGVFVPLTGAYITPKNWGCLDATLFVFEDKPYLCFSNEWTTPITNDGDGALFMAELSVDLKEIVGKPTKIVSGKYCGFAVEIEDNHRRGYVAEGPYLYREGQTIVLLWSTFTDTGYSIVKSVSKDGIMGTYAFEKILYKQDGGHCMRFVNTNDEACILFHQPNYSPMERMQIFDEGCTQKRIF